MKICSKCGENKPESEFGKRSSAKDGLHEWCKECVCKSSREYKKNNPEKAKLSTKNWKTKNKERCYLAGKKWYGQNRSKMQELRKKYVAENRFHYALKDSAHRAKKFGYMPCNATIDELESAFKGRCEICGVLESDLSQRLHVDHDHVSGNFRGFLCGKCNRMLGYADDNKAILEKAIDYLK
jgi:hypothetical protein